MNKELLKELKKIKKQQVYFENMKRNNERKKREKRKETRARNKVREYNRKNNNIFPFGVSEVYEITELWKKINWCRYYTELYIVEYFHTLKIIRENKRH